jgi:hypothetical protein
MRFGGQAFAVGTGWDDHFEAASGVDDGAGEDLVGAVGEAADPDQGARVLVSQFGADGVIDQLNDVGGQPAVAGDGDPGHEAPA